MPDIIDNVKVGEYIKKLLKEHNMTQDDLADKLSISKSAVSQNLRGKSSFDIQNLIQIAKLFDITLDELLNLKTETSNDIISEYQKVVQKGLSSISNVPVENLRISQPDLYGKVLMDYIIEYRNKEMFKYIHDNQIPFIEDYYHRVKEIYLKVIRYVLEEELPGLLNYIVAYSNFNGSFHIEDEQVAMIIWGLLDKPSMQDFIKEFILYKPQPKYIRLFKKEESVIPITRLDFLDICAEYHLKNVLKTYMSVFDRDDNLLYIVNNFIECEFLDGIHTYIDHYFNSPISWVRKVSLEVQKAYLSVMQTHDFELIRKFAEKGLYTDLTPIVRLSVQEDQTAITSHLVATYHDIINFKKVGEACVQKGNITLLNDMLSYLTSDDLNYLLSFVKLDDMTTLLYLLKQGARVEEKYYNFETFKKINQFIDYIIDKGDKI